MHLLGQILRAEMALVAARCLDGSPDGTLDVAIVVAEMRRVRDADAVREDEATDIAVDEATKRGWALSQCRRRFVRVESDAWSALGNDET